MVLTTDLRYDVFLSFRGVDTRRRFISHLNKALMNDGYNTFNDDEEIEIGNPVKSELESAITSSWASVIVLSEDYASSKWCLKELVLILEQENQFVLPIFYDVKPTDVRKQQNSFGKAMEEYKRMMEEETDAEKRDEWAQNMESWKMALTKVADLKGEAANDWSLETKLIEKIIGDINIRLGVSVNTTQPQLIGMDDHINKITSWLKDGSLRTTDILTIWGVGGIGKTSLAKHVYDLHRHDYTRCSFVEDISKNGLLDLQKQLYSDISKIRNLTGVHNVSGYTSKIENALALGKVLLVLDDVDSLKQLDALLGKQGVHAGSKIIITTKDTSLTERCELFKTKVKQPKHTEYKLQPLQMDASLILLCHHAFMSDYPDKGYEEVSIKLAKYCHGHPLTLKDLGKSLYKRDVLYWEDFKKHLEKEHRSEIKSFLKKSFASLPTENAKKLVEHGARVFVGKNRDFNEKVLKKSVANTRGLIKTLKEKKKCVSKFFKIVN